MRPVDKSLYTTNLVQYDPYGDAKPDLIEAIGKYCSYCEREGFSSALDVEHIKDKDTHSNEELSWSNFLLACKNCNSIKGIQEVDFENVIMPHTDNTFFPFEYLESGFIKIKDEIEESLRRKVVNLVDLVGLNRYPNHSKYSTKDDRWQERKQAWELSRKYLKKYKEKRCDQDTIIDLALNVGFWSIWMHAFKDFPEVQKELVLQFKGTNQIFFNVLD